MKAFHTEDLALVKHVAIVSDYTVTALNPEEPICMSTCFGSYGAYMANFAKNNLHYGALIGNISTTKWADSAVGYITFYHQYFKELPIEQCVEIMKIASGDDRFKLHWGNVIHWQLKELTFAANMFR